jgi:ERCC4-type nuclease
MNHSRMTTRIIADDREHCSAVIAFLQKMTTVDLRVKRLAVGDFRVDEQLIFERKTLVDFSRSIIDGRLFRQMIRLANADRRGVLILEGTGKNFARTTVRREAMQGALITVSLILGIPVLRARSPEETAALMITAARQFRTASRRGASRPGPSARHRRRQQLHILQGLPGIGREKAERLLETFGSVQAVCTAHSDQLQAVAGIGEKTAAKIRWCVREPIQAFGFDAEAPL